MYDDDHNKAFRDINLTSLRSIKSNVKLF